MYLDNSATTPLSKEVKEYIIDILDEYHNPSSTYQGGANAKAMIEQARSNVAKFINADVDDIYFTSGGAASNTLAIKGYYQRNGGFILYSPIAHKSILKCVENYKYAYSLKVDNNGIIDQSDLREWLDITNNKPLVVVDYANGEIGTIQDVKSIIDIIHFYNGIVYLDCTASLPSIPLDVKNLDVDMIGFSAHKLGGLKGCGVLYKKKDIDLEPIVYGSQEQGLFGGTENILGIAALGKAVENYDYSTISILSRDYVYNRLRAEIPDCYLVGSLTNRLPHNLYMCFKGIQGNALMLLLDENDIQVSIGSACNSGNPMPSTTLSAIGFNKEDVHSCIRMSFSGNETKEELNYLCEVIKNKVNILRNLMD